MEVKIIIVNDDHRLNNYISQHGLNDRIGARVLECGTLRYFEKDEIIMATGEPLDYYYLIALPVDDLRNQYFENTQFLHHLIVSLSDKLSATMNNSSYNLTYPRVNRLSSFLIGLLATEG